MTQLTDKTFAVKVPEGATNFRIMKFSQPETFSYDYSIQSGERCTAGLIAMIDLPPGSYTFLFCTKDVTEEQAHAVVEHVITANELPVYRDYLFSMWLKSAVGSLRSLLKANGCEGEFAVVEKI